MKLVNEEGRFQLIKNDIVEIDNTLPKYKKLEIIKDVKEKVGESVYNNAINSHVSIDENQAISNDGNVDKNVREIILQLKSSNLRKYLSSKDAEEFNREFLPILQAEKKANSYSLNITNSRWRVNSLDDTTTAMSMDYATPTSIKPYKTKPSFFDKLSMLYDNVKVAVKKTDKEFAEKEAAEHVVDFFDIIHVEAGKEKDFIDKLEGYFKLIKNASIMHQDAQLDELCQGLILHIYESVLAVHGFNKYITFGEIEKLNSPGKRVVDIDYIKNFGRIIPDDIVQKKILCDELCVFDNYVVMYYDPSGATYKVPAAAKRDPIIFGVINHSNKLYYIGDWIDDKCDLTLDKVAELSSVENID